MRARIIAAVALVLIGVAACGPTAEDHRPSLLGALRALGHQVGAQRSYDVRVELSQDNKFLPAFIVGHKVVLASTGRVEAAIDLNSLPDAALHVSDDRSAVAIVLPGVVLGQPQLDLAKTNVVDEERGVVNRVQQMFAGNNDLTQSVYAVARQKITEAAVADGLPAIAELALRATVTATVRRLGYSTVDITFAAA